jgi:hypothetical protein
VARVTGQANTESGPVECLEVSDRGLVVRGTADRALDVLFDGRRVLSFWLQRDTSGSGAERTYAWPDPLRRFLDGRTTLSIVDHVTGTELYTADLTFGTSEDRIRVEDGQGNPLGFDKSMRLTKLFATRSAEHVKPLLDSMEVVLEALEKAGVRPFLAYGTLLGAVRAGELIGHDSDADLGYVSAHEHPFDVVLESFRLQRALRGMGFQITRYSGLAFKVTVLESDGSPRGLDVFGGFMRDGQLYLMGEVGHPFRSEWLEPRQQVTLEGREFPAPARPDRLLEAMYGPSWRVPDPAFQFETPRSTQRRLNGWFRGTRVGLQARWARFSWSGNAPGPPSAFATWVRSQEPDMQTAIDLGCGTGSDALWLARQGVRTWGLDFFPRAFRKAARRAKRRELPVTFQWANLSELRSVLVTGTQLAREPGPRVILARHLADATDRAGRDHLLRLSRMLTRDSGRLYLQVQTARTPTSRRVGVTPLDLDRLIEQVHATRGTVLERYDLDERADATDDTDDQAPPSTGPTMSRLVISWNR